MSLSVTGPVATPPTPAAAPPKAVAAPKPLPAPPPVHADTVKISTVAQSSDGDSDAS